MIFLWIVRMVKVKTIFPFDHDGKKKRNNGRKYLIIWSVILREHLFFLECVTRKTIGSEFPLWGLYTRGTLTDTHPEQGVILQMESIAQLVQTCFFHSPRPYSWQKPWKLKRGSSYISVQQTIWELTLLSEDGSTEKWWGLLSGGTSSSILPPKAFSSFGTGVKNSKKKKPDPAWGFRKEVVPVPATIKYTNMVSWIAE